MASVRLPRVRIERGSLDSPAGWALASLLAHVALASALILISSRIRPPVRMPIDPGFTVSLASLPPGGGSAVQTSRATPPANARAEPARPPDPVPVPRETPAAAKPVPKTEATRKPAPSKSPEKPPEGHDPVPGASQPEGESGDPAGPEAAAAGSGPGGQGDIRSVTSADFPYVSYTLRLVGLLRSNWRRPNSPDAAVHTTTVAFTILRDGRIEDLRIEVQSGLPLLDRSVERAVEDSAPFPPLPSGFEGASLPARIVFELTPQE